MNILPIGNIYGPAVAVAGAKHPNILGNADKRLFLDTETIARPIDLCANCYEKNSV
jgi:hypothetical protein